MPALQPAAQPFKAVAGRLPERVHLGRFVQRIKFAECNRLYVQRTRTPGRGAIVPLKYVGCSLAAKPRNHTNRISLSLNLLSGQQLIHCELYAR